MVIVARSQVGASDAEDAVQAALLSAWKHFRVSEALQDPRAWLLRFTANECRNVIARRLRRPSTDKLEGQDHAGPSEDIITTLQRELVHSSSGKPGELLEYLDESLSRAVLATTEDERMVLLLRAVGELSYKEISVAMEVPIGTVMSRLGRAREKVRAGLERRSTKATASDSRGRKSASTEDGCSSDSRAR